MKNLKTSIIILFMIIKKIKAYICTQNSVNWTHLNLSNRYPKFLKIFNQYISVKNS